MGPDQRKEFGNRVGALVAGRKAFLDVIFHRCNKSLMCFLWCNATEIPSPSVFDISILQKFGCVGRDSCPILPKSSCKL
jgi:hypothetical protein